MTTDQIFQACDRLRKAYAAQAVREGFRPDGLYASRNYEIALEVFIAQMTNGGSRSFEEHVQWYLNQIEEQANGQG